MTIFSLVLALAGPHDCPDSEPNLEYPMMPPIETQVEKVAIPRAPVVPGPEGGNTGYFDAPIPTTVHQIAWGAVSEDSRRKMGEWATYCQQMNFDHRLWTEPLDTKLLAAMTPENRELFQKNCPDTAGETCQDIAMYSLLREFGGLFVHASVAPPRLGSGYVSLQQILPMRGLVLMAEPHGRHLAGDSMAFSGSVLWLLAAPNHPAIAHLERHLARNVGAFAGPELARHRTYASGASYLNHGLSGVFYGFPFSSAVALGMLDPDRLGAQVARRLHGGGEAASP